MSDDTRPHVLVVDDHRISLKVAEHLLERLGCRATLARDGHEALAAFREGDFRMVLLDCRMPGFDGYQTAAALRVMECPGAARTPIIGITGDRSEGVRQRCIDAGMDDCVLKPLRQDALRSVLARFSRAAGPLPASTTLDFGLLDSYGFDDDPAELAAFLGDFVRAAAQQLDEMWSAHDRNDADALERVAHSLKGAAGSSGAQRLAEVAAALEHHGARAELDACADSLRLVDAELSRIRARLRSAA